jgi:hypothetical protein
MSNEPITRRRVLQAGAAAAPAFGQIRPNIVWIIGEDRPSWCLTSARPKVKRISKEESHR